MRDRLRAAEVNPEIIDDICGWSSQSVGQSYGDGYSLKQKVLCHHSKSVILKIMTEWFVILPFSMIIVSTPISLVAILGPFKRSQDFLQ